VTPRASFVAFGLLAHVAWIVCLALAVVPALPVRADPFHAQTLPLGQRAIGMGGAFTAVADDPSATFYNPAGLVLTNESSLSASLTLNAFDRVTVENGFRTQDQQRSLNHNTSTSLPVFLSAVKTLGRRGADGRRRHAVALSSFTRSARRVSFDLEARGPVGDPGRLETLSLDTSERTVYSGLSYSYRVTHKLSLGLSNFVSVLRTNYAEERIGADLGAVSADSSFASTQSSWSSYRVQTLVRSLVWRLGALYAVSNRLQLGLMFQPPSLHLRGSASVRTRILKTDLSTNASSLLNVSESSLSAHDPTPWELRLGGRYALYEWLTIALDGSLYGPTGDAAHPVIAVGPRSPNPETGAIAEPGSFFAEHWYRTLNGNLSLGASVSLPKTFTVRAGLYTDLSSAPSVPKTSVTYTPPDVNRLGSTLSVGLRTEGYDVSVGAIGVFGRGKGLSFSTDPSAGEAVYERTVVRDRMFLVFLNGVRSAISRLATHADQKLKEIRDARERTEQEQAPPPLEPRPDK
jgi:long-chain fatty acid transport protein